LTSENTQNFAIVGGGMLGLTLALRLTQAGHRVTVYEAAGELGGLAGAWQVGDVVWDRHYHVTLLSDTALRRVLGELGLEQEMEWVETRTGFYTDGKLVSMSNTLEFLRFPPLGLLGKLRLGATIFYAARIKNWKQLEQIRVADWLTKLSGRRTFEKIWLPLLRAKLGESYREASAAFIWATIARMYAARRTGLKKEMFGYVPGGYARVLEQFGRMLAELGVTVKLNSPVGQVRRTDAGLSVESAGETQEFDRVIVTAPGSVAARMAPELAANEKTLLEGVRYQGIVCASLLLRKPLADYYVTNITDEVPFTAVIEMSALVDREKYFNGQSLIYLPKYVAPDDPAFELTDGELRERFIAALERMYPHFRADDVLEFKVSRVRQVFPLPVLNYSARLPPMRTSVPGLFVINSAHIVNGTLNVNETVQLAERAAEMLLAENSSASELAGSKATSAPVIARDSRLQAL
jgi:protoporphyrinogen oxidase